MQKSSIQNLETVLNEAGWPTCMRDKVITDHDLNVRLIRFFFYLADLN